MAEDRGIRGVVDVKLSPRHTWAVVVGIEEYPRLPAEWNLPGPALDAITFANWLLARDVPADHIRLCLSAPDTDALMAQLTEPVQLRGATHESIVSLMNDEVLTWNGELLIVFWGGHGSIDSEDPAEPRRLYFADASPDNPSCLSLDGLQQALRRKRRGAIDRQAFFIDACARFERRERFKMHAMPVSPARGLEQDARVRQFQFLAADYGGAAANDNAERTGVFSRELLRVLQGWRTGEWPPNLVDVADTVKTAFHEMDVSGRSTQCPLIKGSDWEGSVLRGSDVSVALAERQRRLSRLRAAIEDLNISTRQLVSLYHATVSLDPKLASITDVDAIFDSLGRRSMDTGKWPPEAEFCERVRRYWEAYGTTDVSGASGASGARSANDGRPDASGLLAWLTAKECCTARALTDLRGMLDDEEAAEMRYLVIELAPGESEDAPRVAQAWLYRADRPSHYHHCWTTHELATDATDIDRVRRLITDAVNRGARNLTIEFVTPRKHLGHAPRAWTLESHGFDEGDVGSCYPVVVRWRERLAEPHTIRGRKWEKAATRFKEALATGVSSIERLPATVTDHLALWRKMERGPCGEVLWAGHVPLTVEARHPLICALLGGAVAVCWSTEAPKDEEHALTQLQRIMEGRLFQQLAIALLEGRHSDDAERQAVCAKIVLFCDHLERNPYAATLPSAS
jgi:hypothetical protein